MMKRLLFLTLMLVSAFTMAQAPQGFSYQAVVRNGSGSPIADKMVALKLTLQNASQVVYYAETQSKQTNSQGVVTITIGSGTKVGGNAFSSIPWSNGDVHLKIEIDPENGTNYTTLGDATKLQSVPYSLFSANGGTPGADGISINWRGSSSTAPSTPSLNDAYYNTLAKKSYVYDKNNTWQILAQDGTNGTNGTNGLNGISIIWKGTLATAPASPATNWAYYNSTDKKAYVYDGSTWQILAQDGMPISGTNSQTLYHNGTAWTPSNILVNDGANIGIGSALFAPSQKLDVNGAIRLRGLLFDYNNTSGSPNQILTRSASGVLWQSLSGIGIPIGTGVNNQIAVWNGANGLKGISNLSWGTNFQITSNPTAGTDDPIMEVRNKNGLVVFAVYQSGIRMFVDGITAKGAKGGFAIGGLSGKATADYFLITPDSARVRLKDPVGKGAKGGFAIGGLSGKGAANSYLQLTPKNYFIGQDAGNKILKGEYNSCIGYQAGMNTTGYHDDMEPTDGDNNIFLGYHSGYSNTVGEKNVYIGAFSGEMNLWGGSNTFLGSESGKNNTGSGNTFIGSQTGGFNITNNTGSKNTFIGHWCGEMNTSGGGNVFIGRECGQQNTTGSDNVYIGHLAGHDNTTGFGNVFIGSKAGWRSTESNKLIIDNAEVVQASIPSTSLIYGDFSAKTLRINGNMGINYPGVSGYGLIVDTPTGQTESYAIYALGNAYSTGTWNTSDERYKTNILPVKNALQNIVKLNGVTYNWDRDKFPNKGFDKKNQIGLIAQDVEKIYPELVKADEEGYKAINYSAFVPLLIESIKEQQKKIDLLEEKVKEVDALKAELEAIKVLLKK